MFKKLFIISALTAEIWPAIEPLISYYRVIMLITIRLKTFR